MTKRPIVSSASHTTNKLRVPQAPLAINENETPMDEQMEEQESMTDRITRVTADEKDLEQFYNIKISPTRFVRLKEYYETELEDLETAPFESYTQQSKVDYLLLKNYLKRCRRQLDLDKVKDEDMEKLLPFAGTVVRLCEARQKADSIQGQKAGRDVAELGRAVAEVTTKIREVTFP